MDPGEYVVCSNKKEALDFMAERIKSNPGLKRYRFILERKYLNGDDIVKESVISTKRSAWRDLMRFFCIYCSKICKPQKVFVSLPSVI